MYVGSWHYFCKCSLRLKLFPDKKCLKISIHISKTVKEREESQRKDFIIQFQNWTTTILCINKNSSQTKSKRESLVVQVGSPHVHCGGQGFNPRGGETRMHTNHATTKQRTGKYLMTLNWMLKMIKMVNFMLYAFYPSKKIF